MHSTTSSTTLNVVLPRHLQATGAALAEFDSRRLLDVVSMSGRTLSAVARELEVTPSALSLIATGKTKQPSPELRERIDRWIEHELREGGAMEFLSRMADTAEELRLSSLSLIPDNRTPEEELFEFFVRSDGAMAALLARSTQNRSPRDRRMVALALLDGYKQICIELGEPIPGAVFDLERRLLEEAE